MIESNVNKMIQLTEKVSNECTFFQSTFPHHLMVKVND